MPPAANLTPVVIIGFGGIGRLVAGLLPSTSRITAMSRSIDSSSMVSTEGVETLQYDLDNPDQHPGINVDNCLVFYFAPPSSTGTNDERMRNFLQHIGSQNPRRIVYISTTGVYGDSQGEWINESCKTNPATDRGIRRLDAEKQLTAYCESRKTILVVLRVPGIYGANRLPVERIKQGRPVVKGLKSFTNRIHEEDLARICIKASEPDKPGGVYNVSDGHPGNMTQYFTDIAAALNLPALPEITWEEAQAVMSPEMLSYLRESRRIDNSKMLRELGVELLYPDFDLGLKACVKDLKGNI